MPIDTGFLSRCIDSLDTAFEELQRCGPDHAWHEIFRAADVKEFEIILEQSGSLLKKRLRPYFASNLQVDRLTLKDAFRHAAKHGLTSVAASERWPAYRDNRNDTAHHYGRHFAKTTLQQQPQFISDAKDLASMLAKGGDD